MALFNKQKQDKPKKPESIIGKIIYGFLLFAPLLAILTASLVNIFNENAYTNNNTQVEIQYKYKSNELNSVNDIVQGNIYRFTNNYQTGEEFFRYDTNIDYYSSTFTILQLYDYDFSDYTLIEDELLTNGNSNYQYIAEIIFDTTGAWTINFCLDSNGLEFVSYVFNDPYDYEPWMIDCIGFFRVFQPQTLTTYTNFTYTDYNEIESVEITETETASEDIFYTACNKVEQSNLFNWSKTTGTYTVLTNVCNGIGITNTFTPMLMAYWLIISVIYFLFDIALILIWLVHDKIHALKDAI